MKILAILATLVAVSLHANILAQKPKSHQKTLERDIRELKEGQAAIQKELEEIKKLLRGNQAQGQVVQGNMVLSVDGLPFKGDKTAKLTVVEFSDYQCPFCGRHVHDTLPQIDKEYVQTGKIKYVFSAFPLESIHPEALLAAQAAYCSGDQGKFWEMHDELFGNQRALSIREQSLHAQVIGLSVPTFQQCLSSGKYAIKIRQGVAAAGSAGIQATPTFLFGYTSPTSPQITVLKVISGAQPYSVFKTIIDSLPSLPQS